MRWPWRRTGGGADPGPVYRRPHGGWAALPPIQRTVGLPPMVNSLPRFSADLAAWRNPSMLALPRPEAWYRRGDPPRAEPGPGDRVRSPYFPVEGNTGFTPAQPVVQRAADPAVPSLGSGPPRTAPVPPMPTGRLAPANTTGSGDPSGPARTVGPPPVPTTPGPAPTTVVSTLSPVLPAAVSGALSAPGLAGAPATVLRAETPDLTPAPTAVQRASTVPPPTVPIRAVPRPATSPRTTAPPVNQPPATPSPPSTLTAFPPPVTALPAAQPPVLQPPAGPAPVPRLAVTQPAAEPTPVSRLAVSQPSVTVPTIVAPPEQPPPAVLAQAAPAPSATVPAPPVPTATPAPPSPTIRPAIPPPAGPPFRAPAPALPHPDRPSSPPPVRPTVQRVAVRQPGPHRARRDPAYPAVLAPVLTDPPRLSAGDLPVAVPVGQPASIPSPAPRAVQLSPASNGVPLRSPQPMAGGWRHPDAERYAVPNRAAATERFAPPEQRGQDQAYGGLETIWTYATSRSAVVQREPEPAPVLDTPPAPAPEATTVAASPPPPAAEPPPAPVPEELLKSLYDPLLRRLKAELRRDRERRSSVTDPPIRPM